MTVNQRYEGIQSVMKQAGDSACLFLCMLSIAEQETNKNIDFIWAYNTALLNDCMDKQFFMKDQEKFLTLLTGKQWKKTIVQQLPVLTDKDYIVEKWYNKRTGYTHFKRRAYDTLQSSVTVKEGKILEYYMYTVGGIK